jgi:ribosomal protein S12 methylthiotransferase accessory factor
VGAEAGGTFSRALADALGADAACVELRARSEGIDGPALDLDLAADVVVGPLTLPGRRGCGECARRRRSAADASCARVPRQGAPDETSVAEVLAGEVRAILRGGPDAEHLLDHVLVLDAETRDLTRHRVVPVPGCPVCGTAPAAAADERTLSADQDARDVLDALAGWVDPRTGIVATLLVESSGAGRPDLPVLVTAAPPHVVDADGLRRLPLGWGKGLTLSGAILSAVGEAIERYAASLPDPARLLMARPDQLPGDVLDPRAFALYSDEQHGCPGFPFARFDAAGEHPWIRGTWLGSDTPVWVPAVFTFLSLALRPAQHIAQGTSNGLAAGSCAADAAVRATLELVERDAFFAAWRSGRPGQRVRVGGTLGPSFATIVDGLEAMGASVEVYLLPDAACGTAAVALGLGDGVRYPGVTLGLGAAFDARDAVRQALLELGQTGPYLARAMASGMLAVPAAPAEVRAMLDHAAYYFPAGRASAFDPLRAGPDTVSLGDVAVPAPTPASCAAALARSGVRVAIVDVTSSDVAGSPFRVARALSSGLQPLSYGHGLGRLPVPRVRDLGQAPGRPAIHPIW